MRLRLPGFQAALLDRVDTMDDGGRVANDQTLMFVASACVLHARFRLGAQPGRDYCPVVMTIRNRASPLIIFS